MVPVLVVAVSADSIREVASFEAEGSTLVTMAPRAIQRWERQEVLDRHKERMESGAEKMKERGRIVEHPFGTLKSRCGARQFLMRGLEKCRGEFSLMTMAYNFTRALNILGAQKLREYCAGRKVYGSQMA